MSLRFFCDHCVPTEIVESLRHAGHEVFLLRDHLPLRAADAAVIAKAGEMNCVIVSLNGDFSDIATYPPQHYRGIIAIQVRNHPEIIPALMERLRTFLVANPDPGYYVGKLIVVEVHRIRIRQ